MITLGGAEVTDAAVHPNLSTNFPPILCIATNEKPDFGYQRYKTAAGIWYADGVDGIAFAFLHRGPLVSTRDVGKIDGEDAKVYDTPQGGGMDGSALILTCEDGAGNDFLVRLRGPWPGDPILVNKVVKDPIAWVMLSWKGQSQPKQGLVKIDKINEILHKFIPDWSMMTGTIRVVFGGRPQSKDPGPELHYKNTPRSLWNAQDIEKIQKEFESRCIDDQKAE